MEYGPGILRGATGNTLGIWVRCGGKSESAIETRLWLTYMYFVQTWGLKSLDPYSIPFRYASILRFGLVKYFHI